MERDAAEDLDIIMNHVPLDLVAAGGPFVVVDGFVSVDGDKVVGRVGGKLAVEVGSGDHHFGILGKAAGSVFDNAVSHRRYLVECGLESLKHLFVLLVDLVEDRLALIDRCFFYLSFQFLNLVKIGLGRILDIFANLLALGTQLVVT